MNTPNNNTQDAITPPVAAIPTAGLTEAVNRLAHEPKSGFCEAQRERARKLADGLTKFEYIDAAAVSLAWDEACRDARREHAKNADYSSGISDPVSAHTLSVIAFGTMPREFAETVMRLHGDGVRRHTLAMFPLGIDTKWELDKEQHRWR
jgi:hypothetical protein